MLYMLGTMGIFSSYYTLHHRTSFQSWVKSAEQSELEEVVLTEAEFKGIQWIEEDTEFEWKGKLYDVSAITRENGHVIIQCENDNLEEMLMSLVNPDKEKAGGKASKGSLQPLSQPVTNSWSPMLTELFIGTNFRVCWYPVSATPDVVAPPPRA